MRKGKRRSVAKQRVVGVLVGLSLFVLLPVLVITGAFDCAGPQPGLHCTVTKHVFDHSANNILQAKAR